MLFIRVIASIFYKAKLFYVPLVFFFFFFFLLFTVTLLIVWVVFINTWQKRRRNKWNVEILFVLFRGSWNCFWKGENIFYVSNLGGELEFIFVFIFCFIFLFTCLSFHTCIDVFFWVFSGKTGTFWSRPSTSSCNF